MSRRMLGEHDAPAPAAKDSEVRRSSKSLHINGGADNNNRSATATRRCLASVAAAFMFPCLPAETERHERAARCPAKAGCVLTSSSLLPVHGCLLPCQGRHSLL